MDKNMNYLRNIKKIRELKSKIKSIKTEMKIKYIINFNQKTKLNKSKFLYQDY